MMKMCQKYVKTYLRDELKSDSDDLNLRLDGVEVVKMVRGCE